MLIFVNINSLTMLKKQYFKIIELSVENDARGIFFHLPDEEMELTLNKKSSVPFSLDDPSQILFRCFPPKSELLGFKGSEYL